MPVRQSLRYLFEIFQNMKTGSEDDGGKQLEGHAASTDCWQDHPPLRQGIFVYLLFQSKICDV